MAVGRECWTKFRLNRLVDKIRTEDKEKIVKQYWEFIVDTSMPLDDQIKQVACAIPKSEAHSDEYVISQLVLGPLFIESHNSQFSKPNLAKRLYEAVGKEQLDKVMLDWGAKHKPCPMCYSAEWCFIVWIAECMSVVYKPSYRETISADDIFAVLYQRLRAAILLDGSIVV